MAWCISYPAPGFSRGTPEEPARLTESPQDSILPDQNAGLKDSNSFCKGFNFYKIPDNLLYHQPNSLHGSYADTPPNPARLNMIRNEISRKDIVLQEITNDSGSVLAMGLGAVAFLYFMPEDFSKWPDEKKDISPEKLWERYEKNVSNGPVWDHDEWEVNYIGHPYFGAAYYTHAMNKTFNRIEALSYSFMMSTFLYEYGVEAFFEDPSIQDLIITPLVGALFGEVFIIARDSIHDNDNKVWGSTILGSTCTFLLDPITATLKPISSFNKKYSKLNMDANFYSRTVVIDNSYENSKDTYDYRTGVEITIVTNAFL